MKLTESPPSTASTSTAASSPIAARASAASSRLTTTAIGRLLRPKQRDRVSVRVLEPGRRPDPGGRRDGIDRLQRREVVLLEDHALRLQPTDVGCDVVAPEPQLGVVGLVLP